MTEQTHAQDVLDVLRWFDYDHLPAHLQPISAVCQSTAYSMVEILEPGPELVAGLNRLLECKDWFVRQAVRDHDERTGITAEQLARDKATVQTQLNCLAGGGHYWGIVSVGENNLCVRCGAVGARNQGDAQTDFDNSDPAGSEADAQNDGPVDVVDAAEWKGR